jgi:hypothetical protein
MQLVNANFEAEYQLTCFARPAVMIAVVAPPPQQAARHQGGYLDPQTVGALIVGLVIGWLAHVLASRREAKSRIRRGKDEFLATLADQEAKFATMKFREAEFFEQSVPILARAVYRVQPFTCAEQWSCLDQILREYQSHHKSEFEGGRARVVAAIAADRGSGKTHTQALQAYLDRFKQCVHKTI